MIAGKRVVAIVPARGGSKRLPNKNKLDFCGKPLVQITIEAGIDSEFIDEVVVTSDDVDILNIARDVKVSAICRPDKLSSDTATSVDVVLHIVEKLGLSDDDVVVLLQPTSPLRTAQHIDSALTAFVGKQAASIVSVCETEHSPMWSNTLPDNMSMDNFIPEDLKNKRSQDLPTYYRINGAIYACSVKSLLDEKTFFLRGNVFAFNMEQLDSIDIDTALDFKVAKLVYLERIKSQVMKIR